MDLEKNTTQQSGGLSEREAERDLIRRIIAGERDEYRVLVTEHEGLVFSMIQRQVGDIEITREIAQETFVRGYLNLSKFKFESRFGTWITRIALNQTSNYFSSKRFKQNAVTHAYESQLHDRAAENDPQQDLPLTEFQIALGRLNSIHRDVVVLCSLEGKSYEDAASILGIPIGTIRSRLNKARLLLRDLIIEQTGKPEVSA